jgi:hypothetical protein
VIEKVISKIKAAQQQAALNAVSHPPAPDQNIEYLYGQRVGYYAGLDRALHEIEEILRDRDEKDARL